jgi:hypothetical protein
VGRRSDLEMAAFVFLAQDRAAQRRAGDPAAGMLDDKTLAILNRHACGRNLY